MVLIGRFYHCCLFACHYILVAHQGRTCAGIAMTDHSARVLNVDSAAMEEERGTDVIEKVGREWELFVNSIGYRCSKKSAAVEDTYVDDYASSTGDDAGSAAWEDSMMRHAAALQAVGRGFVVRRSLVLSVTLTQLARQERLVDRRLSALRTECAERQDSVSRMIRRMDWLTQQQHERELQTLHRTAKAERRAARTQKALTERDTCSIEAELAKALTRQFSAARQHEKSKEIARVVAREQPASSKASPHIQVVMHQRRLAQHRAAIDSLLSESLLQVL